LLLVAKLSKSEDHPRIETYRHSFAQKNKFKGPWDAGGKVVKTGFKRQELEDVRVLNAFECYMVATENFPNSDLEKWATLDM
jgi:hypothetical protein